MTDERLTNAPPPDPRLRGLSDDLHTLPAGYRVGRYEIRHVLGHGGFGITYRAHDTELHRDVAIKEYLPSGFSVRRGDGVVLPRSTEAAETFLWGRERFVDEARTLARLERASGIVNVHDIVQANGTAYMVMEFLRGETLEALLKRDGRLSQKGIERLLNPLLDGLEQVHGADFLHRDIKPANILIDETGTPKLIDFGASRMAVQGRTQVMTAIYTPGYAAPEQMTLAGKQGPWTDIYALGATLYHCVAGAAPGAAIDRLIGDPLVPAREAGGGRYAPELLAAIDAALQLKPEDRLRSVAAWRARMLAQQSVAPVAAEAGGATRLMDGRIARAVTPARMPTPEADPPAAPAERLAQAVAPALPTPPADATAVTVDVDAHPPRRWRRLAFAAAILCLVGAGVYVWRATESPDSEAAADAARLAENWARRAARQGAFADMTDATVCRSALDSRRTSWQRDPGDIAYREEAHRRGLSIERCRELTR